MVLRIVATTINENKAQCSNGCWAFVVSETAFEVYSNFTKSPIHSDSTQLKGKYDSRV